MHAIPTYNDAGLMGSLRWLLSANLLIYVCSDLQTTVCSVNSRRYFPSANFDALSWLGHPTLILFRERREAPGSLSISHNFPQERAG